MKFVKAQSLVAPYELVVDFSIAMYYFSGLFDVFGSHGWYMVMDRMFMLISFLLIFLAIYKTDYIALSIAEHKDSLKIIKKYV